MIALIVKHTVNVQITNGIINLLGNCSKFDVTPITHQNIEI